MINQKRIKGLEKEIKPHREQECQCHKEGYCTCSEDEVTSFSAEGWHCISEFRLQCEINSLKLPRP